MVTEDPEPEPAPKFPVRKAITRNHGNYTSIKEPSGEGGSECNKLYYRNLIPHIPHLYIF